MTKSQNLTLDPIVSFETPPVIETVLGFQFKPLPALTNSQIALFWNLIKADWPNLEETGPIAHASEKFGDERSWEQIGKINFTVLPTALTRLKLVNKDRSRMIQIQNGRLHYNWVKVQDGKYPQYRIVRQEFDDVFKKFREFLSKNSLGQLDIDQWEVTYVNFIPKGTLWNSPEDWPRIFPSLSVAASLGNELKLDSLQLRSSYEIAPRKGRVHIQISHAMTNDPNPLPRQEIIRVDLTARGGLNEHVDLDLGLHLGRKSICDAFVAITSPDARKYWGQKNAS